MKLLLIGATGRTGQEVLKQCLEAGHEVKVYARQPEKIEPHNNLDIIKGELNDIESLSIALKNIDAVIMSLGNPMSKRNDKLFEWVVPNVIKAMNKASVKRIVSLSALGVGNTLKNTSYPYRFGASTFLKGNFKDHYAGEVQFSNSNLDWTTVHPGPLFNEVKMENPLVKDASTGYKMPGSPKTNRADVAQVMIQVLNDQNTFKKELVMASVPDEE